LPVPSDCSASTTPEDDEPGLYHGWGVRDNEFVKAEKRGQDLILILDEEDEDQGVVLSRV